MANKSHWRERCEGPLRVAKRLLRGSRTAARRRAGLFADLAERSSNEIISLIRLDIISTGHSTVDPLTIRLKRRNDVRRRALLAGLGFDSISNRFSADT